MRKYYKIYCLKYPYYNNNNNNNSDWEVNKRSRRPHQTSPRTLRAITRETCS